MKSLFRNGGEKTKLNSSYIPLKPTILRLHYRFHFHSTPSGICRYSVWICWKRHSDTSPLSSFGRVELSRHSLKKKSNIFMNWLFPYSNFEMKSHVRPLHKFVFRNMKYDRLVDGYVHERSRSYNRKNQYKSIWRSEWDWNSGSVAFLSSSQKTPPSEPTSILANAGREIRKALV